MDEDVTLKQCRTCQKISDDLFRCSKCKDVYYCNQECQRKDWVSHKSYCKAKCQEEKVKNTEDKELGMDEFKNVKGIGTGNFSIIFRGESKKDGKIYAIKQIEKAKVKRMRKEADVFMEKHCLGRLSDCSYIVKLYKTFQDELNLYFKMECPKNGELWEISKNFGIIPESIYHYFVSHIIKGLSILHNEYNIVHRDLKPENILLSEENQIKIIDFGTAKDLDHPEIKGSGNGLKGKKPFEHYVGTPNYMSPQCIHNTASEKKSDIYSLGGVLYFLKVGSPPFAGGSEYLVYTKSLETKLPTYKELFSEKLQDLIERMNVKEMAGRIQINEVMKHPYFEDTDFENLITYAEAQSKITEEEKQIVEITKKLTELIQYKGEQPELEQRRKIYNEKVKPYLQGIEIKNELLKSRMGILDIQCQVYLNTRDNTNDGFAEIYKPQ